MAEAPLAPETRFATPEEMQTADKQPLQDRLNVHALQSTAAVTGEPNSPRGSDEPVGGTDHQAASVELSPSLRNIYANGLVSGETSGPADFAQSYTTAHIKAGQTPPVHPDNVQASLPSNEDMTNYSIALTQDNGLPMHPNVVRAVHQNLADAWAVTGVPPADIYRQAQNNSSLSDALTRPQPISPGVSAVAPIAATDKEGFLNQIARGESGGDYNVLYGGGTMKGMMTDDTGFPQWAGKDNSHAAGRYQFEPATWHAEYKKLGLTGGMTPENQDLAAWDLAQSDYGRRTGRNLDADLAAGNRGTQIADALHSTWTSLGHAGANVFASVSAGVNAVRQYVKSDLYPEVEKVAATAQTAARTAVTEATEFGEEAGKLAKAAAEDAIVKVGELPQDYIDWWKKGPLYSGMKPEDVDQLAQGFGTDTGGMVGAIKGTALQAGEAAAREAAEKLGATAAQANHAVAAAAVDAVPLAKARGWASLFSTPVQRADKEAAGVAKATVIRETGLARQAVAQAKAELDPFQRQIQKYVPEYQDWLNGSAMQDMRDVRDNRMDFMDHVAAGNNPTTFVPLRPNPQLPAIQRLVDHIEGVPGSELKPTDPLFPVAEGIKLVNQATKKAIADSGHDTSSYLDDYYRHMWQDPTKTDQVLGTGGRQGNGSSLLQRSIPTIGDGIRAGLKPRILDPIENTLNYVSGMRSYLAAQNVLKSGEDFGHIQWSRAPIEGLEPLKGNGATRFMNTPKPTERAMATPGFAAAYNNWVGRGFYDWGKKPGQVLDKVQSVSNGMTGLKLAISGYHALAITVESHAAGVASALGELGRGQVVTGLKDLGLSAIPMLKPVRDIVKGRQGLAAYLRGDDEVANLYAKAGGRIVGRGEEYGGQLGNTWDQIRHGVYGATTKEDFKGIAGKVDESLFSSAVQAPSRAGGFALHQINGVLGSITAPLFDKAIPAIKYANFADEMQSWLRAHPAAGEWEKEGYARTIQRSMDDRFGELVQDNLFVRREIKQLLNSSVVSLGWEFGTLRGFTGAAKDIVTGNLMTPRARWIVGFVAATAYASHIYQYLKTGTLPEQTATPWLDMIAPRNATQNDDGTPGRSILPGYQKDVIQYYKEFTSNPSEPLRALGDIASAKFNPFVQTVKGIATGKTWMGTDIRSSFRGAGGHNINTGILPNTNYTPTTPQAVPEWWTSYLDWAAQQVAPIGLETTGNKGLGEPEQGLLSLGIRKAPPIVGDQEAYAKGLEAHNKRMENEGMGYAHFQNNQLENPDTTIPAPGRRPTKRTKK